MRDVSTDGLQIDCRDNICTYNGCGRKAQINQGLPRNFEERI